MFGKYKDDKFLGNIKDDKRLIAQIRNISEYENKSKEDLIKALSKPKPEPPKSKPKSQTPKPKPETPKPETKQNKHQNQNQNQNQK